MDLTLIHCAPMQARITKQGCAANRLLAKTATVQILEGISPFLLGHAELDRLMWCCTCERYQEQDDVNYRIDRRLYNDEALDLDKEGIERALDVVDYVQRVLVRNLLRIERMDMQRGNTDTSKHRRRIRDRRRGVRQRIDRILIVWVRNPYTGEDAGDDAGEDDLIN